MPWRSLPYLSPNKIFDSQFISSCCSCTVGMSAVSKDVSLVRGRGERMMDENLRYRSEGPFGKTGKSPCEQSSGKIGATRKFIMVTWENKEVRDVCLPARSATCTNLPGKYSLRARSLK